MVVKPTYRRQGNPSITSYSYTDIADGTGIQVFYGYGHKETTTQQYGLSTEQIYSYAAQTYVDDRGTSEVKLLDLDFDVVFNTPKNLYGKARIVIPHAVGHPTTANKTSETYCIAKLRKWDGTTETEIAQATTKTFANQVNFAIKHIIDTVHIDINTITHFKKGETMRLTIEVWAKGQSANGTRVYLHHDGKNRLDSTSIEQDEGGTPILSQLSAAIPFKIDL